MVTYKFQSKQDFLNLASPGDAIYICVDWCDRISYSRSLSQKCRLRYTIWYFLVSVKRRLPGFGSASFLLFAFFELELERYSNTFARTEFQATQSEATAATTIYATSGLPASLANADGGRQRQRTPKKGIWVKLTRTAQMEAPGQDVDPSTDCDAYCKNRKPREGSPTGKGKCRTCSAVRILSIGVGVSGAANTPLGEAPC